jgi:hypothetical protein
MKVTEEDGIEVPTPASRRFPISDVGKSGDTDSIAY